MKSIGYHAFYDKLQTNLFTCSYKSDQYPLVVNCAGIIHLDKPFTTNNPIGRKDYYLLYITEGHLDIAFPEGLRRYTKGSLVIFPPLCPYTYSLAENKSMKYYYVHFSGSDVDNILKEYKFEIYPSINQQICADSSIIESFSVLFESFSNNDRLKDRELYLNLDKLLMSLARHKDTASITKSNKLSKSVSYIHSSFGKQIKIKDLANIENMSVSAYNILFVKTFGMAPGEYITAMRLTNASTLLLDTNIPIKQIGAICGYPDPQFFSKIFKSHLGLSPREYRNQKRTDLSDDKL